MITLTERAREHLKGLLAEYPDTDIGLRLVVHGTGQFALMTDTERKADQVVEHEGRKVLLVDEQLVQKLERAVVDCEETAEGLRLVMVPQGTSKKQ